MGMELKLYDTLTRQKRRFDPIEPTRVRLYVCGPTVYDFAHIGNARPVIVFDVLFRLLRHIYGADHVVYVRNVTDVDDKINARAAEEYPDRPLNESIRTLTERTERQFHEDVEALGCLPPSVEPRATEHIEPMKVLIERLVASGHAYVAQEHALFSVASMPEYGRLSRRSLDEMIAGARVDVAPYKRDPMDFVLWKPSQPGEPAWPSPAGIAAPGRPGWHIECSAMSWKHLGEVFDIHGGGIDLIFPHHENEIAQTRSAFHSPVMANYWMHNGFLQVEGEKMSKSLGNFFTIRQLLADWPGEVLRVNMLRTHYRQPIDWTTKALLESKTILDEWYSWVDDIPSSQTLPDDQVMQALSDDLNTPSVLTRLHALVSEIRSSAGGPHQIELKRKLKASGSLLGILERTQQEYIGYDPLRAAVDEIKIRNLIDARTSARKSRNFKEADVIRDELTRMGIEIEDHRDGTTSWKIKRRAS
ncbi:MAG: cysteinyl-tRNA synthetase [Alphaproteobacteria bacterium]|jgi:cysteinyl-tRNA synthetase|nr:cysteinyl-tRNA synthetase [Alphaproteobacteria bacterium]